MDGRLNAFVILEERTSVRYMPCNIQKFHNCKVKKGRLRTLITTSRVELSIPDASFLIAKKADIRVLSSAVDQISKHFCKAISII
jgi:hypothetical protein